jgi:translation initiation factor eIF-2B subunit delta
MPSEKLTASTLADNLEKTSLKTNDQPLATPSLVNPSLTTHGSTTTSNTIKDSQLFVTAPDTLKLNKKKPDTKTVSVEDTGQENKVKLFHHFEEYKRDYSIVEKMSIDNPKIHPAFIKLGIQYAHDRISGSNARCLAFLNSLKQFLNDYKAPSKDKKSISEDLEAKLKPNIK